MDMKYIVLFFLMFALVGKVIAQKQGKIEVIGSFRDTLVICNTRSNVAKSVHYFQYEFNGRENKTRIYSFPDNLDRLRLFFSCDGDFTYLELKAGETITIELTAKGFRFKGANALKNEYLYDFCRLAYRSYPSALGGAIARTNVLKKNPVLSPSELFDKGKWKKLSTLEDKCLKQLRASKIDDVDFVRSQEILIKYLLEDMLLCDYAYAKAMKYAFPESCLQLMESITFDDADFLDYPRSRIVLSDFARYLKEEGKVPSDITNYLANCAGKIKDQKVRESYIIHNLNELIQRKMTFNLLQIFDSCYPLIKTREGCEAYATCRTMAESLLSVIPADGEKAYPFAYKNQDEKLVKLSDFKGKYVFVDIWATWCGPCKAQMPYLKQLENEMHGKNIEFVSISVDVPKDRQKWLDYVKENEMVGHTLMADNAFKDEMMIKYGVKAIPRFILIDPKGNIVSSNTPQPRYSAFREYLKKLVK